MANDRPNTMQAGMGLSAGATGSQQSLQPATPTPADTSLRLMEQARQQMQYAKQNISTTVNQMSQQFQQNYESLKASTYMSPQVAQALYAARTPGYTTEERAASPFGRAQDNMLPSPLLMTPAETGVFRPRGQQFNVQPLPPIALPSLANRMLAPTGMGVMLPPPRFQSAMEQQSTMQDQMSMQAYAHASQIPGVLGTGMGFGAAALAGAKFGRSIGGKWGGVIGAGVGAIGAGLAGIPSALGNMADTLTGIPYETIKMGAALQDSTRNFMTSGIGLSPSGRGLGREAARELASGLRSVAAQDSTFNKGDMMKIVDQGGQAGLFDMAQSVPEIRNKVRETASTIKEFMSLTNDPDITNVIRQLGQMQQMGMTQGDMVKAAQGMKMYAKQAGTTAQGLQDMGGAPGAYSFQQAGLTAGQGFQYGNFAAASARNLAATGNLSAQQLALMGGISGITQRDINAQAAFASMPLYGAANAKFGAKGWGAAGGADAWMAKGGAAGMVTNAYQALSAGVQQGGVGALAMYNVQKRQVADSAVSKLTPEEQMVQRYMTAINTGKSMGMKGMDALSIGSQMLFSTDVAEQMVTSAGTSGFMGSQMRGLNARSEEIAYQQQVMARSGTQGFWSDDIFKEQRKWVSDKFDRAGNAFSTVFTGLSEAMADMPLIGTIPYGQVRSRLAGSSAIRSGKQLERLLTKENLGIVEAAGGGAAGAAAKVLTEDEKRLAAIMEQKSILDEGTSLTGQGLDKLFDQAKAAGVDEQKLLKAAKEAGDKSAWAESVTGRIGKLEYDQIDAEHLDPFKEILASMPEYQKADEKGKRSIQTALWATMQELYPEKTTKLAKDVQASYAEKEAVGLEKIRKARTADAVNQREKIFQARETDFFASDLYKEDMVDAFANMEMTADDWVTLAAQSAVTYEGLTEEQVKAGGGLGGTAKDMGQLARKGAGFMQKFEGTEEGRGVLKELGRIFKEQGAGAPDKLGVRGLHGSYTQEQLINNMLLPSILKGSGDMDFEKFIQGATSGSLVAMAEAKKDSDPLAKAAFKSGNIQSKEYEKYYKSVLRGAVGGDKQDTAGATASGEEGARLNRSKVALESLGQAFDDFAAKTKPLTEAAQALAEFPGQLQDVLKNRPIDGDD